MKIILALIMSVTSVAYCSNDDQPSEEQSKKIGFAQLVETDAYLAASHRSVISNKEMDVLELHSPNTVISNSKIGTVKVNGSINRPVITLIRTKILHDIIFQDPDLPGYVIKDSKSTIGGKIINGTSS